MLKKISLLTLLLASLLIYSSCGDDDDDVVDTCDTFAATYNGDVNAIINATCAYAGCHAGGSNAGPGIPVGSNDFTNFASLESVLNNGAFNNRALVARNMPPAASVPAGFPTELTAEQLEILTCWRDAGFPEN